MKKSPLYLLGVALISSSLLFSGCSSTSESSSSSATTSSAQTESATPPSNARNTPIVQAAKKVGPSVVGITNKAVTRDWFNRQVEVDQGTGSGVIFRKDGYIVTNNHVVKGAKDITVALADGRTLQAKLVGTDPYTDLAVIKVDADDLPAADFGNSDDIMVGEPAIAIGNPMGLEFQGSVTAGVISALNRTLNIGDNRVKLLQTDAAINPGNSGGALVNADGQVIGINSAKLAATGVEGMGFAIPINTAKPIIDELMEKGHVDYPYIGVGVLDKQTAAQAGYKLNIDAGIIVMQVDPDSPAASVGIQQKDIILKADGKDVNTTSDLLTAISAHKIGDTITLTISRNGQTADVNITLAQMPSDNNQQ